MEEAHLCTSGCQLDHHSASKKGTAADAAYAALRPRCHVMLLSCMTHTMSTYTSAAELLNAGRIGHESCQPALLCTLLILPAGLEPCSIIQRDAAVQPGRQLRS